MSSVLSSVLETDQIRKAAQLFKIPHFKKSFITKLKALKINIEINLISEASILSKYSFTFNMEKDDFVSKASYTPKHFYILEPTRKREICMRYRS